MLGSVCEEELELRGSGAIVSLLPKRAVTDDDRDGAESGIGAVVRKSVSEEGASETGKNPMSDVDVAGPEK